MTDQPDDLDAAFDTLMPAPPATATNPATPAKTAARKVQSATSPAARARKLNMLAATPPQDNSPQSGGPAPSGFVDSMADTGKKITNYLRQGLGAAQDSTNALINSSPTLSKVRGFIGDAGSALSEGVGNAPLVPQAMDSWKSLPTTLRDANSTLRR